MRRAARRAGFGLSVILATGLLTGCASRGPVPPPVERISPKDFQSADLWKLYAQAVEATKYPQPSAISTALVPIVHSTPGLQWDEQGRVLMVAWTKKEYYESSVGKPYTFSHGDVWLTAVPFLQNFCKKVPQDLLAFRLKQVLGLRPNGDYDAFVQMWVDPKDFFRPCADPEITDRECTLNLTIQASPEGQCPWQDSFADQVSLQWVSVRSEHLAWMCDKWNSSFPSNPQDGFPWTALGYTYDWGQPKNPVGESEFVAPNGTTVVIESVRDTAEYCAGGKPPA